MGSGRIVQVIGAVIDVEFPRDDVPNVYDALVVAEGDLTEVQQQLGDGIVRTIAMGSSEGVSRGLPLEYEGTHFSTGGRRDARTHHGCTRQPHRRKRTDRRERSHADPPRSAVLCRASGWARPTETGVKVIDLICPFAKGGKVGCSAGRVLARRYYARID